MNRLKWLAAALFSSGLIAAPIAAQAADYAVRRHHHRHHHHHHHHHHHYVVRHAIPWFSYLHNYGPGPLTVVGLEALMLAAYLALAWMAARERPP